jgi:hypothetical protein
MNIVDYLCQHVKFDLNNGPYITGSLLTKHIAEKFYTVAWQPADVDIICRTTEQAEKLNESFTTISSSTTVTHVDFFKRIPLYNSLEYKWIINGIEVNTRIHDVSAQDHVNYADYTVGCITSDGVDFLMLPSTLYDIEHKLLKHSPLFDPTFGIEYRSSSPIFLTEHPSENILKRYFNRYKKYVGRGFIDTDNIISNSLKKLSVKLYPNNIELLQILN